MAEVFHHSFLLSFEIMNEFERQTLFLVLECAFHTGVSVKLRVVALSVVCITRVASSTQPTKSISGCVLNKLLNI